jgi:hypothetical protein
MTKFAIIFALTLISSLVFSQYATKEMQLRKDLPSFEKRQNIDYAELTKSAVWSNDFSNPSDWTVGHAVGAEAKDWVICTDATAPPDWLPMYGMPGTFASATATNGYAFFNSVVASAEGDPYQDSWVQLTTPIDLSLVETPRIIFQSYYKKWFDTIYLEYSTDGGSSWGQKELFTEINQGEATAVDAVHFVNIPEVGNEANVLIRFRFTGDWDYGCFIDDISIIETPDYDLQLLETATNFFQCYDYSEEGAGYHYSSHYGHIPYWVLTNENALIISNAIVKNEGAENATPVVNVIITNPDGVEAYNYTYTSDIELLPGEIDTLDIGWTEDEYFLTNDENWVYGKWDISFQLSIVGQVDGAPNNNAYSTYYMATDYLYAEDGGNLDGVCGPGIWLGGGNDGDMFGVNYLLFETTTITSVQAFVVGNSDPGTSFICHIMMYDEGSSDWVAFASSELLLIDESHLDTWVNFTFADPATVSSPTGEGAFMFKIALEFYYGGDFDLWIGEDNTMPSSFYSASWRFVGEYWTYIYNYTNACPMIRADFTPTMPYSPSQKAAKNISIYPNPSTGIVNINNVEGARIEVLNMVGQVVKTIENAAAINSIDLSNNANGTYFVRVVNGNVVSTTKINILK